MRDALLTWVADLTWRRPWTMIVSALLLAVVSGGYAALRLELNADTDDLISPSRPFMAQYRRLQAEFGDLDYVYVAVGGNGDPERTRAAVDDLTSRLQDVEDVRGVYSGITPPEQLRIATRAMPDTELEHLARSARGFTPFLQDRSPDAVAQHALTLLAELRASPAPPPPDGQERVAGAVFALSALAAARESSESRQRLAPLLGDDRAHEYFRSPAGHLYFITVIPAKDYGTLAIIEEPLRQIRAAMDAVRARYPDVDIGLTGKTVLQADEMATSSADTTRAAVIAFVLVAGLFMIILRGFYKPALAALAFLCAGAWTYGFAALAIGYLNLLSIVFALVLVGIGFDFGIHLIARYNEYRATLPVRDAMRHSLLHSGPANITSAFTSAAVFLMALVTPFRGLQELGLIAGVGLLLCLVAMMIVLPALLTVFERGRDQQGSTVHPATVPELRAGVLGSVVARPRLVLGLLAAGTAALLLADGRVRFEDNLLELQAPGLESVQWEHRIIRDAPSMTWFGAVIADSQAEVADVVARAQRFETIGLIRSVLMLDTPADAVEVTGLVRRDSAHRDALRTSLHQHVLPSDPAPAEDLSALDPATLLAAARAIDQLAAAAAVEPPDDEAQLQQLAADLRWVGARIGDGHPDAPALRQRMDGDVASIGTSLQQMLQGDRLSLRDVLPDALRDEYVSDLTGRYLVLLHPRSNVWEYDAMRAFVSDLRAIDPEVTGAPIATYESVHDMRTAFVTMAVLAFGVVTLLVWLDFRSAGIALLAMAPLVLGLLWLTEIMGLAGISFNLANFFSVSILLGVTVDGAVHVLHRYREGGPSRLHLGSTRRAVILTSLTTMIGFGSLIIAQHRGLQSLSLVMFIGSAACLTACLVGLPAFLAWRESRRT